MEERNYWQRIARNRLTRRRLLSGAALGGVALTAAAVIGCEEEEEAPPAATPTAAPTGAATPAATATPAAEEITRGGILQTAGLGISTLDPNKSGSWINKIQATAFYSRYFMHDWKAGDPLYNNEYNPINDLIESYEAPDPQTFLFKIRDNANFFDIAPVNGRTVTAQDSVFSWNRYVNLPDVNAGMMTPIVDSVQAVDDKTVQWNLKFPYLFIINRLAGNYYHYVLPEEAGDEIAGVTAGFDITQTAIGSGPWQLEKLDPDVALHYKKNPGYYHEGRPYLDGVVDNVIGDTATLVAQFQAGNLHHAHEGWFVDSKDQVLDVLPDTQVLPYAYANNPDFMYWGKRNPDSPFRDERVRLAVSMAMDREALMLLYTKGNAEEAAKMEWNNLVSFGIPSWWLDPRGPDAGPSGAFFQHNPEEARKLLEAAGYPDGFDTNFVYVGGLIYGEGYEAAAQAQAQMLSEVGIRNTIIVQDYFSEYIVAGGTFYNGTFDGLAYGLQTQFTHPDDFMFAYFHPDSTRSHSGANPADADLGVTPVYTAEDVAEILALLDKARASETYEEQRANFDEIQRKNAEKMFIVPMAQPWLYYLGAPALQGFSGADSYGRHGEYFTTMWLKA